MAVRASPQPILVFYGSGRVSAADFLVKWLEGASYKQEVLGLNPIMAFDGVRKGI